MTKELTMTPEEAFDAAMRHENRANPYPFFDELRKTPVARVTNGIYAVTGYEELMALAHDPRVSSDLARVARRRPTIGGSPPNRWWRPPKLPGPTGRSRASSRRTRPSTTGRAVSACVFSGHRMNRT